MNTVDTGYRGLWYCNQPVDAPWKWTYSGGLGTYTAKHIPLAIYVPAAHKTFFVYGGTRAGENRLLIMASYYDHATGTVPRPVVVADKATDDGHDNPAIQLDDDGYVYVFASAHGTGRPARVYRSRRPHDITVFDVVLDRNYSYPQAWFVPGGGFLFLHTLYDEGRWRYLHWATSPDGRTWSEPRQLARVQQGHYQVSDCQRGVVGTAFNYHPNAFQGDASRTHGVNWRTNLYYAETRDMGATWQTADGARFAPPVAEPGHPCRVVDCEGHGLLAYMKDLCFDREGRPAILHVVSRTWEHGPGTGPREWRIAHWTGAEWTLRTITTSDHNYDTGCLHIEPDGVWRVVGPTEPGRFPHNPGGEVAIWASHDGGRTWTRTRQVTRNSPFHHTYVRRPVNAHPDFYAFWADGHPRELSESRLYFCDRDGQRVMRLPSEMRGDVAELERVAEDGAG